MIDSIQNIKFEATLKWYGFIVLALTAYRYVNKNLQ